METYVYPNVNIGSGPNLHTQVVVRNGSRKRSLISSVTAGKRENLNSVGGPQSFRSNPGTPTFSLLPPSIPPGHRFGEEFSNSLSKGKSGCTFKEASKSVGLGG